MHTRRPSAEHQEAVSRRLALLSAELAGVRPPTSYDEEVGQSPDWTDGHTRIRSAAPAPGPGEPEPPPDAVPAVPTPGRHAARRAGRAVVGAVPETLRGRVLLGPAQVTVVALLIAAALAVACWWVVRASPAEVSAPTLAATASPLVTPSPAASAHPAGDAGPTGSVTVDVAGKVRRPGIAVLDAGSRVVDALRAAGGARPGVALASLNLARVLVDGEQILVGVPGPAGPAASAASSPGAAGGPLVNLNTATQTELEALPEVGPVTAQAIIAWRTDHGGFSAVDELLEVDGIGDATLGRLAPYVTV